MTKITPFWPLCWESEAILTQKYRPSYSGCNVHMEDIHPGRKNRDLNLATWEARLLI